MYIPWQQKNIDPYALLISVLKLHLDENKGSYYWKGKSKKTGINYTKQIASFDELYKLGLDDDLLLRTRQFSIRDFAPKGFAKSSSFEAGQTSGTSGFKKWMPCGKKFFDIQINFANYFLDKIYEIPRGNKCGDWLNTEPIGHYNTFMQMLAESRNNLRFPLGVEGKHAKKVFGSGNFKLIQEEYGWLLDEWKEISMREKIGVVTNIPQMLEFLPSLIKVDNLKLVLFIGGGFTGTPEEFKNGFSSYRKLKDVYRSISPSIKIGGWYGEGHIGSQFHYPDDTDNLNYYSAYPNVVLEVVDPETGEKVKYGERGKVIATRITPEFLWRWDTGDEANRIPPKELIGWDGIQNVSRYTESAELEKVRVV